MIPKEMFSMAKMYYKTAFDNFELFQKNSEQMLRMFLNQHADMNSDFMKQYEEWLVNSQKGYNDYRKLVLDGLDYLADTMERQ
ncbi:MAG: hypothetical protein BZ151_12690 [Desulfobacca sp. 4484_104]|nr:MAG: hypothetical protein BZ151_12690 [Desulfobacca sp. 4484_104]RLB71955.1 MAG: hypothetical protein DRH04_00655 [Deltaproteobacteria bacterium]